MAANSNANNDGASHAPTDSHIPIPLDVSTTAENGTKLQMFGKSGSIRILKPDNSFMQLWLDKLEEIDANGAIVQSSLPLAASTFTWNGPAVGTLSGVAATIFTLSATLTTNATPATAGGAASPSIPFSFTVYLFTADGTVTWAGETWPVTKGQVKYTIDIQGWPFKAVTNRLNFGVRVKSQGGRHTSNPESIRIRDGDTDAVLSAFQSNVHNSKVSMIGPVAFIMPKLAQINDLVDTSAMLTTQDVIISMYKSSIFTPSGKGNDGISWSFPYFSKHLVYDPTIDSTSALADSATIDAADTYVPPLDDTSVPDSTVVVADANFRVQVLGQSGKIRILKDDNSYFQLALDKLEERSSDNTQLIQSTKPFAAQQFHWTGPTTTTLSGVAATLLQLSAKLTLQGAAQQASVPFVLSVYIFQADGSISWAGQSWDVTRGQLKFTLDIQDWPFKSTSNKLQFGLNMDSRGGQHTSNPATLTLRDGDADSGLANYANITHNSKVSLIGPAAFVMPKLVQINTTSDVTIMQTSTDMAIDMYASSNINGKSLGTTGKDSVQWTFPYFSKHLIYDPTIDVTSALATSAALDPNDGYLPPAAPAPDSPVDANEVTTDNGLAVKLLGQSCAIRITKQDNSSIQLSLDKLEELDSSGAIVQSSSPLSTTNFAWHGPTPSVLNDVPVTLFYVSSTLSIAGQTSAAQTAVAIPFVFQVFIFNADGVITWAGQNWNVKKGQVKFTINIQNWPFQATSNRLRFGVCVKSNGGKHKSKAAPLRDGDTDPALAGYRKDVQKSYVTMSGPAALLLPKLVQINDPLNNDTLQNSEDLLISAYDANSTPNGYAGAAAMPPVNLGDGIQWTFPYFSKTLVYDPTIDLVSPLASDPSIDTAPNENVPGSDNAQTSSWKFALGFLAVCVVVGAGFYLYQRQAVVSQPKERVEQSGSLSNQAPQTPRRS